MRIALIVEGKTEKAFLDALRRYLTNSLKGKMPRIDPKPQDGRIPKGEELKRLVENLLAGHNAYDAVIALTDVYTGTSDFTDASDAKGKMREWVGENSKFYPHAAQHNFEAWLLPYWETIQKLAEHNMNAPSGNPEDINHNRGPAYHIEEIFSKGKKRNYNKPREAAKILEGNDLNIAVGQCPELKSLINTILTLCGVPSLP